MSSTLNGRKFSKGWQHLILLCWSEAHWTLENLVVNVMFTNFKLHSGGRNTSNSRSHHLGMFILWIWQFLAILWWFLKKKHDSKKNFLFFKFLEIAFFEHNLARFEEKKNSKFQKIFFLKISHFGKSVILDTIFDFWLALHTPTICLWPCYHVYSRNFYVTCTVHTLWATAHLKSAVCS